VDRRPLVNKNPTSCGSGRAIPESVRVLASASDPPEV
jgi:hypothetical protein